MALDDIKKLIDAGKEKGYLTYDQVNDLIPHDVHSPEDLDDLLTTIGTQGIDVLEGPKLPSSALDKKFEEEGEVGCCAIVSTPRSQRVVAIRSACVRQRLASSILNLFSLCGVATPSAASAA